jgi:quercetin dioxygenase-like cupin family protein
MQDDLGWTGTASAWPHPLREISTIPGQEAGVRYIERAPGANGQRHFHPGGHEWVYVVSGSLVFTNGAQPEKTLRAGEVDYIPPDTIHNGRNPSTTEPVKLVLFYVKPKDAPLLIRP